MELWTSKEHALGGLCIWCHWPISPMQEKLRFFFEADFSVKAVIDRLPREFEHNRHARVCILEQVSFEQSSCRATGSGCVHTSDLYAIFLACFQTSSWTCTHPCSCASACCRCDGTSLVVYRPLISKSLWKRRFQGCLSWMAGHSSFHISFFHPINQTGQGPSNSCDERGED